MPVLDNIANTVKYHHFKIKLYKTIKGSGMQYSKRQIEKIATEVRDKYGGDSDRTNVVQIAKALGFNVYEASFKNPQIAGKVIDNDDKKAIYVNRDDITARKRFTVAHELGHIILHHPLNDEPFEKVDYRGVNETFDRKEWEANQFAASLLMPKEKAVATWEKLHDVDDFAEYMGVSKAAAAIRLESLGLI